LHRAAGLRVLGPNIQRSITPTGNCRIVKYPITIRYDVRAAGDTYAALTGADQRIAQEPCIIGRLICYQATPCRTIPANDEITSRCYPIGEAKVYGVFLIGREGMRACVGA